MTLSPEYIRTRLDYSADTGRFTWRRSEPHGKAWNTRFEGKEAFTYKSKRGYLVTNVRYEGKPVLLLAHRVAWAHHYGEWPSGQIDHIDGNRLNNRVGNLRDVTSAENAKNMARSSANTSGVTGVYLHSQTGKWTAQINAFGHKVGLGCFEKWEDAVIARKAAERVLGYHPNHGRSK